MLTILQTQFNPGDVLAISCGIYTHYTIISDQYGPDAKPMLISASNRTGTVREEIWSNVITNEKIKHHPKPRSVSAETVLKRARSQAGSWSYNLLNRNCEHFVNWCTGLGLNSKQIKWGAGLGLSTALLIYAFSNDHRVLKAGAGLIVGTATGVALSKNTL